MTDTTTAGAAPVTTAGERIAALAGALQAIMDFHLANPDVPTPSYIRVGVWTESRAQLDGLAGDFDQEPPGPAYHYNGAQFDVPLEVKPISTSVLIAYHEGIKP
jgi:hypothetical protein